MRNKLSRIKLYWKMIVQLALGSKLRLSLTVLGMSVGIFVFAFGNLCLDSYLYARMKEIRIIPEDSNFVIIPNSNEVSAEADFSSIYLSLPNKLPTLLRKGYSAHSIAVFGMVSGEDASVYARMIGVSQMNNRMVNFSDIDGDSLSEFELVEGRYISEKEISENEVVAVIDEFTSQLLFGQESAIDKTVELDKLPFTIVGVVANNYHNSKRYDDFKKKCFDANNQIGATVVINIYTPYRAYEKLNHEEGYYNCNAYMWSLTKEEMEVAKEKIDANISLLPNEWGVLPSYDKAFYEERLLNELRPIRQGIMVVSIVLMIIAGISSMSILFFSIKERASEIGIKKAFGASSSDIALQFLLENLFISIISAVLAVTLSRVIGYAMEGYVIRNWFADFQIHSTTMKMLFPIAMGGLQGILFSLPPCIYASRKEVSDILRIDS